MRGITDDGGDGDEDDEEGEDPVCVEGAGENAGSAATHDGSDEDVSLVFAVVKVMCCEDDDGGGNHNAGGP